MYSQVDTFEVTIFLAYVKDMLQHHRTCNSYYAYNNLGVLHHVILPTMWWSLVLFAIRKQGFISDRAKILISDKVDRLNVALLHIYTYF